MKNRLVLLTVVSALVCGGAACPKSADEAALNRRNADIGIELAKHSDPVVAVSGAEVAANSLCLDATTFDGAGMDVPTPASPEESEKLRDMVAKNHAADKTIWEAIKTGAGELVGLIPGGSTVWGAGLLALTTIAAWWRKRKWQSLAVSGIEAIHDVRDKGLKATIEGIITDPEHAGLRNELKTALEAMLKARLRSAHDGAGVADMAQAEVDKAKP